MSKGFVVFKLDELPIIPYTYKVKYGDKMFKIDFKKLEKELNLKKKTLYIELFASIIINIVLYIVYFIITKKNSTYGIISLILSAMTIVMLIITIKNIVSLKKCISNAKYLSNKGILLRNQKIKAESTLFNLIPCLYYIDSKMVLHKLKINHTINFFGKSKVDLLIDENNPKRYFIDTDIKTTSSFNEEENNKHFSDKIYYPNYITYYEDNSININSILIFILLIGFFIYIAIVKEEIIIKGLSGAIILFSIIGLINNIRGIINNNKIINKIKKVSKTGKLCNNLKYEKELINNDFIYAKVKYDNKEYESDKIKYLPDKDKIDLLIDEKTKQYYIDYDIETYLNHYKKAK